MPRDERIEIYYFKSGSLTSDSNGNLQTHSNSINGKIQKIEFLAGNYTATGSLFLFMSGAMNERVWYYNNSLQTNSISYPYIYGTDSDGNSGSPDVFLKRVVASPLKIIGSGLGAGTSGLNLNVYYN